MKCLKCGYVTSESKEKCARCGSPLPVKPASRVPARHRQVTPPAPPEPAPPAPPSDALPDWRKEVSRKVKAYGEKKKILTTPPQPLKEGEAPSAAELDPDPPAPVHPPRPRIATSAFSRVEPPEPFTPDPPPAPPSAPHEPEPLPRPLPPFDEEIFAEDLNQEFVADEPLEEEEDAVAGPPLYLGRRTVSFVIDSMILVALHTGLLYLCSEIISYNFHDLFVEAWLPLAGIFLLFHCLYYLYFYKTSRQTPGQVFFGIELRDPLAGTIAVRKILLRWLCMVVLNIFNLVPVVTGRRFLVLDRVSGTQVRTLK